MPKNTKIEKSVSTTAQVAQDTNVATVTQVVEDKKSEKKAKVQKAGAVPVPATVPTTVAAVPATVATVPATVAAVPTTVATVPTIVADGGSVKPAKKSKASKAGALIAPATEPVQTQASEPVQTQASEPVQTGGTKPVRYFRCMFNDATFGRFSGYKPKQAAGKALTSILRHIGKEGKDLFAEVPFSMIECTRGGNHKVSQYNGKRLKLEKPVTVTIKTSDGNKKEIKYNFTNKITKVKSEKKVTVKVAKKVSKKVAKKVSKKVAKKVAKTAKKTPAKKTTEKKAEA